MRGWDEFSEFLPESRVPTSADFNTYPIRIFFKKSVIVLYPIFKHTLRKTMKEERKINSCHGALNLTKGRESFLK